MPFGAEAGADGGVHFRVWAPARRVVEVVIEGERPSTHPLEHEDDGYHAGFVADAGVGTRYRFRLDGRGPFPDPASRFQPDGPHGPSMVVDPAAYRWSDGGWRGLTLRGQVLYEMHVGTFTREGTWRAAMRELPALADVGVTAIEMMPVADFPGRFGWGYDGVALFAPTRLYGTPDDLRAFVDRAHALGIGVLLDVVYNHFGPDGCYLREYADEYFSTTHRSEWGESPNFDGERCGPVREFFLSNAAYWVDEFHLDGLRLDATQSIVDESEPHVLVELGRRVREAARGRGTLIVNENEPQQARLVRPPETKGGCGLDMIWNDDWHHTAIVALTGQDEAYYTDYRGSAQELVSAAKHGFLYQGQWYRWQRKRRGSPAFDLEPARFVHFLENHDQIANSGTGARPSAMASPARWRALTALLLLGPQTPMLFQGQEWKASSPFLFFADHRPELARQVTKGRREFMAQFANLALPEVAERLALAHEPSTFERCKLDRAERERNGEAVALHRDLLRLRREDPCFANAEGGRVDGAVLAPHAFVLRWFGADGDRLLVVNLGQSLHLDPAPEPLLAPPEGMRWAVRWSSQQLEYGGLGTLPPDAPETDRAIPGRPDNPRPWENWRVQGETALVLAPVPHDDPTDR
ncbi:MAG TPA: malto-oligosyltrehalose trehalohydrolase [Gemmatimonadaceae bacterium]|nr:malto-oligosyltrehalose trehalohydrolase [Gemmatimonadaceae bacterium]